MVATHSVALDFIFHNFRRVHQSLRVTPAMEAGLSDHVWSTEELVGCCRGEKMDGVGIALRSLQFALSVVLLALFLGRNQEKQSIPIWLRIASPSNIVWGGVVLAGVLVSAAILLLH